TGSGSSSSSSSCWRCCTAPRPRRTRPSATDLLRAPAGRPFLAVLGVERQLEPDGLALRGRARAPPGGELLDQVQAPAALVGRAGGAQPRQPEVGVERLHPDRL